MGDTPKITEILKQGLQTVVIKKVLGEYDDQYNPGHKTTMCILDYHGQEGKYYFKDKDYRYMVQDKELKVMLDKSAKGPWMRIIPEGEENDVMNQEQNQPQSQSAPPVKQDNKELSIVTQSILHIPGYYDAKEGFYLEIERAITDANYLLRRISERAGEKTSKNEALEPMPELKESGGPVPVPTENTFSDGSPVPEEAEKIDVNDLPFS